MYPFGVIGVAPRYIPAGAVIELAGFRLGCTSTSTGIRETQAGGNQIQGHLSRGGPESRADSCADACVCEFVCGYVCAYVRVRALLSSVSKGSHF